MMNTHFDIVVLGTGPAGSAAARGLASLGYAVLCLAQVRSPGTVEGISERVVKALQHQGFTRALRVLSEPIPRQVLWNGAASAANTEHLVDRQRFDAALIEDLQQHGVKVAQDWVSSATNEGDAWQVTIVKVSAGPHQIVSLTGDTFGLMVYAYDDYVSYAYPGGMNLEKR